MWIESKVLAELIEPTLSALRSPSEAVLAPLLGRANKCLGEATNAVGRNSKAVHQPSYELGVATTLMELLGTAEQRSEMGDALNALNKRTWGPALLHELALIEKHASPVKQGELARRLSVDSGNLSRRIQELIALNLIERGSTSRAGTFFGLTPLGRDLLDEVVPGWQAKHPKSQGYFANDAAAASASTALVDQRLKEIRSERVRDLHRSFAFATQIHTTPIRDLHSDHLIVVVGGAHIGWPDRPSHRREEVQMDNMHALVRPAELCETL